MHRLVLGTAQMGLNYGISNPNGQISHPESKAIFNYAQVNGLTMLDTAIAYGSSERTLGEIGVPHWDVISKLPAVPEGCEDVCQWVSDSFDGSCERLRVKSLYGFLLHRPQDLLKKNGDRLYEALLRLKSRGQIRKIGVSIYDPAELEALCGRYQFDIVQAPFSIIDRRMVTSDWLFLLVEQGIEVHARSIFLQGLLLVTAGELDRRFRRWLSLWLQLEDWFRRSEQTPLQACLRYVLSFPQISKVIVGVDGLKHLKEICAVTPGPIIQFPSDLHVDDIDLLNPARWAAL